MIVKASLTSLMIYSLSGCSTLEIIHSPVDCLGLPQVRLQFTQDEANSMSIETVNKIVLMRETYKARINAQCEINLNHDKLHRDK